MSGIMSGYGIHVSQLTHEDVDEHKINLGKFTTEDCIGVYGEDLVRELVYVIAVRPTPVLVWHSPDMQRASGITAQYAFAAGVVSLARTVLPELDDLLNASRHDSV